MSAKYSLKIPYIVFK